MTTKEKVEDIESKIAVDQITVEKFGRTFQIYPWLKGRLFHKEITGTETIQTKTGKLFVKQLLSIFYGIWNIFGKYDVWSFTHSGDRRLINEKYYDKIFDFAGNEGGLKVLLIEMRLVNYYPYRKIASKRLISKSMFVFLEEFYGRFILRLPKVENQHLLDELNAEFSGEVSQNEIVRKYLSQYKMMRFWLRILPNPKVVFLSVSYTNFGYIRAFKEKGIEVVEFQHGLITKNHNAYFYKTTLDPIQFPDQLVTVGECENEVFDDENKFPPVKLFPVGSHILDHYTEKDKKQGFSNPIKLLFSFQDGVIGDKLAQFIIEILPELEGIAEVIIQTRRTPAEVYKAKFKELEKIHFSEKDFYMTLLECDVHVTVYSTTAVEALTLGRQNILVNIDNFSVEQLDSKLGENEFTTVVEDVQSFVKAVKELKDVDKNKIIQSNLNNFKPGYKENVLEFLKQYKS